MDQLIQQLAQTRQAAIDYRAEAARIQAEIKASELGQRLQWIFALLDATKLGTANLEVQVRQAALETYGETRSKQPHPAIQVKIFTVLNYDDGCALDYARQHLPQVLKFDRRSFDKIARVLDLDFVTSIKEPRVTIARDLTGLLASENNEGGDAKAQD